MKKFALALALCLFSSFSIVAAEAPKEETSKGKFSLFLKFWDLAKMDEKVSGKGKLTILIPTDAAFKELNTYSPHFLKELQKPESAPRLERIMSYHVIMGEHDLTKTTDEKTYSTLLGPDVLVRVKNGALMINDATVEQPNITFDVSGMEGMVDVINRVLIPPPVEIKE